MLTACLYCGQTKVLIYWHDFLRIRMRSEPSKFVTRFEVFIIVSAVVCGAVTGLVAWKSTRKINSNLRKVIETKQKELNRKQMKK